MERIKKYVDRFLKNSKIKREYDMKTGTLIEIVNNFQCDPCGITLLLFRYGYAKGYRACQSEQKRMKEVC